MSGKGTYSPRECSDCQYEVEWTNDTGEGAASHGGNCKQAMVVVDLLGWKEMIVMLLCCWVG